MVNQAISAVCGKLSEAFGFPVYTEPHMQGVQTPAFFVTADNYTSKQYTAGRRKVSFDVTVQYLPPDTERRREDALQTGAKLEELFDALTLFGACAPCFHKKIGFRNLTRGFNRGFQVTDEVLVFSFDIVTYVYTEPMGDPALMEALKLWQKEKEDSDAN